MVGTPLSEPRIAIQENAWPWNRFKVDSRSMQIKEIHGDTPS